MLLRVIFAANLVNMNLNSRVRIKYIFFMNFNCYYGNRQLTMRSTICDHSTVLFLLRYII